MYLQGAKEIEDTLACQFRGHNYDKWWDKTALQSSDEAF